MASHGVKELVHGRGKLGYVQVNQRDLIDKMLARYCSDFVIVREFTQNADDAGASSVSLEFETQDGTTSSPVTNLTICNNGRPFTDDDWERITRIAEGNPDQESVGMFGVGFYAAFALTEHPTVRSGSSALRFFWEGSQLATEFFEKVHELRKDEFSTSISMPVKDFKVETWDFAELRKYLVKAIAFTKTVSSIRVLINGSLFCALSKTLESPATGKHKSHNNSPKLISAKTYLTTTRVQERVMAVTMEFRPTHEEVTKKKRKLSHKDKDDGPNSAPLVTHRAQFRHIEALASSNLSRDFMDSARRIIKKDLPKESRFQLLFPHSLAELRKLRAEESPLQHLSPMSIADMSPSGQVFIGLATHQTTGSGFHVHAQFIPTIERENIDFQDPTIGTWNRELCSIVGQVARYVYDSHTTALRDQRPPQQQASSTSKKAPSAHGKKKTSASGAPEQMAAEASAAAGSAEGSAFPSLGPLQDEICAVLAGAALNNSTPSAVVGQEISAGFLRAPLEDMLLPTSNPRTKSWTLCKATSVLLPNKGMEEFVSDHLPVVPVLLSSKYHGLFDKLADSGLKRLSAADLADVLEKHILSEKNAARLLVWYCANSSVFKGLSSARKSSHPLGFLSWYSHAGAAGDEEVEDFEGDDSAETVRLRDIHFYTRKSMAVATAALPIPNNVLPSRISSLLPEEHLTSTLNLKELPLMKWVEFVIKETKLRTPEIATCVFIQLSRRFGELKAAEKQKIKGLLATMPCIPTTDKKCPMKIPGDAYLPSTALSGDPDLPFVKMPIVADSTDTIESMEVDGETSAGEAGALGEEGDQDSEDAGAAGVSTSLLRFLGVRSSPSLQRLMQGAEGKSASAIIQAIMAQGPLSSADKEELRNATFLPGFIRSGSTGAVIKKGLYKPTDLHFQSAEGVLGQIKNVPFLDFPGLNESSSGFALLRDLGVSPAIPLTHILTLCTSARSLGPFTFFVSNFRQHYAKAWKNPGEMQEAFLPITRNGSKLCPHKTGDGQSDPSLFPLSSPATCVVRQNPLTPSLCSCARDLLGEHGINPLELGVRENVEAPTAVAYLSSHPPSLEEANETFAFMNQLSFTATDVKKLKQMAFIPTPHGHLKPEDVILASSPDVAAAVAASVSASASSSAPSKRKAGRGAKSAAQPSEAKRGAKRVSKRKAKSQSVVKQDDDVIIVIDDDSEAENGASAAAMEVEDDEDRKLHSILDVDEDVPESSLSHPKLLQEALKALLVCVDFGPEGNQFLLTCQVQTEPSAEKLASLMLSMHDNVLSKPNGERLYLALLFYISKNLSAVSKPLLSRLKSERWLIGYRRRTQSEKAAAAAAGTAASSSSSSSKSILQERRHLGSFATIYGDATIAEPRNIFLIDESNFERLLSPLSCPELEDAAKEVNDSIKRLYEHVGCQWLSSAVHVEFAPSGKQMQTPFSAKLEERIKERAGLVVLTPRGTRQPGITEAAERKLQELVVREVSEISQTITFQSKTLTFAGKNAPPCCLANKGRLPPTMCVVSPTPPHTSIDMFFVSRELCKLLFKGSPSNSVVTEFKENLTEDLEALKRRGVPVDHLISRSKGKGKGKGPAVDELLVEEEDEEEELLGGVSEPTVNHHKEKMPTFQAHSHQSIQSLLRGNSVKGDKIVTHHDEYLETSHECIINDDLDLRKEPKLFSGFPLFIDSRVSASNREQIMVCAPLFGALLNDLCSKVFDAKVKKIIHIYHDVDGAKIAYNSDKSIFCNLRYFIQAQIPTFHPSTLSLGPDVVEFPLPTEGERTARNEWFVTLCHEIAHNESSAHDHEHESAMERLIVHYLPKL